MRLFRGTFLRKQLRCEYLGMPPPNAHATFNSFPLPPNPPQPPPVACLAGGRAGGNELACRNRRL